MISSSANGEDATTHPLIRIEGNDQFASTAKAENWPGEGTANEPYVIDNLTFVISGDDTCIYIANTDCYFELSNCTMRNTKDGTWGGMNYPDPYMIHSGRGIVLVNVTNAILTHTDCSFLSIGILLDHCDFNILRMITGEYDDTGIALSCSDNNTLEGATVSRGYYFPLSSGWEDVVEWSDVYLNHSCNNTIRNTRCWGSGGIGIGLSWSENNLIISSIVSVYRGQAILIVNSDNNTLFRCGTNGDRGDTVHLISSDNVTVESGQYYGDVTFSISSSEYVTISNTTYCCARLVNSDHCLFVNNTCVGGGEYGIHLVSSDNNTIQSNNIRSCSMNGVFLFESNHNLVVNNKVDNGVYSESSAFNIIENNTISRWYDFAENEAWNVANKEYSYSLKFHDSFNNTIIGNRMRGDSPILYNVSRVQAFDDGSNIWNSSIEGNYWEDWTRPDQNNDGIVDRPYLIDGGNNSDHLPIAGDRLDLVYGVEPSLTIESPSDCEVVRAATVTIAWDASYDPSEAFMSIRIDGGVWQYLGATSNVTLDLEEGEHTVQVAACDQNGENELIESVTFALESVISPTDAPSSLTTMPTDIPGNDSTSLAIAIGVMITVPAGVGAMLLRIRKA